MSNSRNCYRRGFTLVELVVSIAAASLLIVGLTSSIFIATKTLDGAGDAHLRAKSSQSVAEVLSDLRLAKSFSERTAIATTFTVPDRDGDTFPETIRYSWSGVAGDPLLLEYNGSSPAVFAKDVHNFDLSFLTRSLGGEGGPQVTFQEFVDAKQSGNNTSIIVSAPSGILDGDLLIAAVATDGDTAGTLSAPAGWSTIDVAQQNGKVTLGVWWKVAASESGSYQFSWSGYEQAYAWVMRFTGQDTSFPINVVATAGGNSTAPTSPGVNTTVNDTLILRIGGFDTKYVTSGIPGLAGHSAITMEASNNNANANSGGAGFVQQESMGTSGTSTFSLTSSADYRTVTIGIAAQVCP